jgi:membrane protease YdiL (CAAX protease family)
VGGGLEVQGRDLVGLDQIIKSSPGGDDPANQKKLLEAAAKLNEGNYSQRLRYAILVGELSGPSEARKALDRLERDRLEEGLEAKPLSIEVVGLLSRLYEEYEHGGTDPAKVLSADEREKLRKSLGWYGELALAPKGGDESAREAVTSAALRTAVGAPLMVGAFLVGVVAGVVVLAFLLVRVVKGRLPPALTTGGTRGGVYVETFALYLLLFLGLSYAQRFVDLGRSSYLGSLAAMFLSLAALAWPLLRGVAWSQVREDVGLTFAARPWRRVLMGLLTYVAALPLLALALLSTFLLMKLLHRGGSMVGEGPSHPVVSVALQKDWWVWLQVFLVAVVGAPIVEEITFRGLLYRHLRELTGGRMGAWLSVWASVLLTGLVFAVIHPQGWLGVPALLTLATAFALAREWQRSLLPSMIAHGLNNGLTLLFLLIVAG